MITSKLAQGGIIRNAGPGYVLAGIDAQTVSPAAPIVADFGAVTDTAALRDKLVEIRRDADIDRGTIAAGMHLTPGSITHLESRRSRNLKLSTLAAYADVLGLEIHITVRRKANRNV